MGVILGKKSCIHSPKSDAQFDFAQEVLTFDHEADYVIDMAHCSLSVYVCTKVVESRVVGDSVVPLYCTYRGQHGDVVAKSFDTVQYVPSSTKN